MSFKGQTLADPSCSSGTDNTLHWPDRWLKSLLWLMNEKWLLYTNLSVSLYTACLLRPQPQRERLAWTWCLLSPYLRPHHLLGRLFVHRPFLVPLSSQIETTGQGSLTFGQHCYQLCLQGYLDFYVKTKNLRRAPFYILSVGNAVLMMVTVILNDFCDTSFDCLHSLTKVKLFILYLPPSRIMSGFQVDYLRGLLTLESLVVLCLVRCFLDIIIRIVKDSMFTCPRRRSTTSTSSPSSTHLVSHQMFSEKTFGKDK